MYGPQPVPQIKSTDKILRTQTLSASGGLTPGILVGERCKSSYGGGSPCPIKLKKTFIYYFQLIFQFFFLWY